MLGRCSILHLPQRRGPRPGFTRLAGRSRILFEQTPVGTGFFADWTLNFTDTVDSNGDA